MSSQAVGRVPVKQATIAVGSAGLVFGLFLGGLYALWALSVISGAAQSLMDFISRLHFIRPIYVVQDVNPLHVAALVVLSAVAGYAIGGACALLWNRGHHQPKR